MRLRQGGAVGSYIRIITANCPFCSNNKEEVGRQIFDSFVFLNNLSKTIFRHTSRRHIFSDPSINKGGVVTVEEGDQLAEIILIEKPE